MAACTRLTEAGSYSCPSTSNDAGQKGVKILGEHLALPFPGSVVKPGTLHKIDHNVWVVVARNVSIVRLQYHGFLHF